MRFLRTASKALSYWSNNQGPRFGAALAFYGIFSFVPGIIIATAVAGFLLAPDTVTRFVYSFLGTIIGNDLTQFLSQMATRMNTPDATPFAWASIIFILIAALGGFIEIQEGLARFWNVRKEKLSWWESLIKERIVSLLMLSFMSIAIILITALSIVTQTVGERIGTLLGISSSLSEIIGILLPFGVGTLAYGAIYRLCTPKKHSWRASLGGGVYAALASGIAVQLIGIYFEQAQIYTTYGTAGAFVALLLFLYYLAQVFYIGAAWVAVTEPKQA